MEALFVYGTLREAHVQERLIGRIIEGQSDELGGYRRDWTLLPPYAVAMPCEATEHIRGLVLEISQAELETMDIYEGIAYVRVQVTLISGREVWVYIGNSALFGP
jgi:gamma-glutamylcyclotransferase (GGCT)/AIG2-like uncharacterized protein YtfP